MKKTIFILILLFFATISVVGQTINDNTIEFDIQDFFAWRTNHNSKGERVKIKRVLDSIVQVDIKDLSGESYNSFFFTDTFSVYGKNKAKRIDSILTPANKEFMSQQIKEAKNKYTWDKKTFKRQEIVKEKPLQKINGKNSYWAFSVPLFTADKQYCFIKETYVCGLLCEDWSALLYKKTADGQWKLVMTIWALSS